MKRFATTLIFMMMITLIGCGTGKQVHPSPPATGGSQTEMKEEETLTFKEIKLPDLPADQQQKAKEIAESAQGGTHVAFLDDTTYIVIALGQRNTGGYNIKVKKVLRSGSNVTVFAEEVQPPKDGFVTQVISYPFIIISVENKNEFDQVEVDLKKGSPSATEDK